MVRRRRVLERLTEPRVLTFVVVLIALLLLSGIFYPLVYFREATRFSILATGRSPPFAQSVDETITVFVTYTLGFLGLYALYYCLTRRVETSLMKNLIILAIMILIISYVLLYSLERMKR